MVGPSSPLKLLQTPSQILYGQANHIFNRLGISSNLENYVVLERIEFRLTISQPIGDPPEGFLFLCPSEDFRIGDTLSFKWPDCPAYWSFDPSGTEHLSADEAVSFGFPTLVFSRIIGGDRWDANVYASLRRFHQAKGFDPDSQGVARHLGYPLYELSRKFQGPFAHIDEEQSCDEDEATDQEAGDTLTHSMAALAPARTALRINVHASRCWTRSEMSTAPLISIPALEPWMAEFNSVAPAANPAFNFSPDFNFDFLMGTSSNEDWTTNSIFPALDAPSTIDSTLFGGFNTSIPYVDNFAVDGFTGGAFPDLIHTVPSASTSAGQFDAWPWPLLRPHPPDSSPAMALTQFSEPGPEFKWHQSRFDA
ncbi:hypothetical protein K438DRAFT_1183551 [Mycena galopus ATCC 62051]|nr:hypothetical protein K438DRAFT_1183551 [Mycena galopus ATCC 62051]